MEATAKGLWLVPTFGRVSTNVVRFIKACVDTGATTRIVLVVDQADYATNNLAYDALDLPENMEIHVVKGGCCADATRDAMADLFTDDVQWLGWLADDLVPVTPGWDVKAVAHLNGTNWVSTNDGRHAPVKANGSTVWSADLIRATGYLYPPGFKHMYIDTAWELLGQATRTWVCDMNILVKHEHASSSDVKDSTFAKSNSFWDNDDRAWADWQEHGKAKAIDAIFALMQQHGAQIVHPDLSGFKVAIAVPAGDGRFEGVFLHSLRHTEAMVRAYGGQTTLLDCSYNSDLPNARCKLFGAFLRSDATHCLWIDSDQGWEPKDFVRLLLAKKDFVAVAGVRKVFPASFAVNVQTDDGKPMAIEQDATNGLLRATGVGMAFTCISRACAERMAQHYADLEFDSADGRAEVGLFLPMIKNRHWRSEDLAFCQRWRDIGGEIWIAPEVSLEHVGAFKWSGAWLDQLIEKSASERAA